MNLIQQHRQQLGTTSLRVPRASFYRQQRPKTTTARVVTRKPPEHAVSEPERQTVQVTLYEPRFVHLALPQVYAQLLEEGRCLCSIRTMYRLLAANDEVRGTPGRGTLVAIKRMRPPTPERTGMHSAIAE